MRTYAKSFVIAILSLGSVLAFGSVASAQIRFNPTQRLIPINPNPEIAPGVRLQQFAYNTSVLGRAYSQIPPYLFGFNPSAGNFHPLANPQFRQLSGVNPFGPGFVGGAAVIGAGVAPFGGGYNPFGGVGGGGGYSAGGIDPSTGIPGGGYGGVNNPFMWNPWGGYNMGSAMELMAYGKVGLDQEQARILREQANQAKLDTRKKLVDTLAYIRANQYTFTQEQADIAKRLLARVQKTPTQSEVNSGKSMNVLLADLVKFTDKSMQLPTITVDEDVLRLVNVSGAGSNGSIALLRDNGRFTWPAAFSDSILAEKERKDIEVVSQQLYQQASNGQLDANTLKDLESSLGVAHANLAKQVNTMPTSGFLEVKSFLDNFDSAIAAMRKGDVPLNWEFQNKFAKGGRTIQQIIDYMGAKGLRFATARSGEERGNVAVQAGLAAYSIALHGQFAAAAPPKDKGS